MTKSKTGVKTPAKAKLNAPAKIKAADTSKVASKTGYSLGFVSNVKAGRRYNAEVVNAFNSLTARRK